MNDFFEFLTQNRVDTAEVIFLMLFSLGIALFQTLIFSGLFNLKFPNWLFFVLSPAIVGISYVIDTSFPLATVLLLFISLFFCAIIGMIYAGIQSGKEEKIEREKFNKKHNIPKTTFGQKILGVFIIAGIFGTFILLAETENLKLLFLIIPGFIILKNIFFPSSKSKFMRLQSILPTSKMDSIAMGMVEVEGDLEEIEPIISPYFNKPCIGYYYKIEKESKPDDNGRTTYSTIFSEVKTGKFKIKDETGSVIVDGEGMEYFFDRVDNQQGGKTRYSETYLRHNDYMFLIGYAGSDNGKTIIKKGDSDNVFGIAIPRSISFRNKYKPLLDSFLITLFFISLLIIYIILN
ncbi:hypothetical protein [Flavobacterium quisquiliarum]|uniref:RING-type E3 ubiquitin transferase n=1 Tax=Flavobacterium quisquiliarum TaxID=1834436 RepID=A0ABV8WB96_9FLAO|nr:hypothetical protein [Flavobacterium quisquiliarum]MBW1653794.1 hypothetical protein [Flavobacterium quisquiliarum]NWK99223.1 hypothetical protein [Flavobacterium collinsii]